MRWVSAERGKKSRGCLGGKGAILLTASEYSASSSIHGISYISERAHGVVSRLAWLLIVLSAVSLGAYWSLQVGLGDVLNILSIFHPNINTGFQ